MLEESIIGGVLGGIIGGFAGVFAQRWRMERRLAQLESVAGGQKGKAKQVENQELEQAAIQEALALIASGTPIPDVIKQVALKYPAVVPALLKKFGGG